MVDGSALDLRGRERKPDRKAATTAIAGRQPDIYEQLKKLAELKDAGVLTEEEFAAQKAKILNT
jgi:Short C-terminal domain